MKLTNKEKIKVRKMTLTDKKKIEKALELINSSEAYTILRHDGEEDIVKVDEKHNLEQAIITREALERNFIKEIELVEKIKETLEN